MKKIIELLLTLSVVVFMMGCSSKNKLAKANMVGGHEYVDLGLPSGLKWATCNVGAGKPEEYGEYFAWGETKPKAVYDWTTYLWCKGSEESMTKYCTSRAYGDADGKKILEGADDAATSAWGNLWRMPTMDEHQELIENCTWRWVDNYNESGVSGQLGKSKLNGNTIFLPAEGHRYGTETYVVNYLGNYWSSSIGTESHCARNLYFNNNQIYWYNYNRRARGQAVRAVVK